jgi:sulfoxide reductase catalytic subunit YedY
MAQLPKPPPSSEVTPEPLYLRRREFLKNAALFTATAAGVGGSLLALTRGNGERKEKPKGAWATSAPGVASKGAYSTDERPTSYEDATTYNNFYEFGTDKSDPAQNAGTLRPRPWTVVVDGECEKPQRFDVDALLRQFPPEERIYRMRCVEAWSMVLPWQGFELGKLIAAVRPTSRANFVAFTTLMDKEQMPGEKSGVLDWPYVEGLRIDEATHPLTLLVTGLYGKPLPNQNGAPIRLVVPWKYGFKGIKSIVKLSLVEQQPVTTWNVAAPNEYGFYANVNPDVDHPRWSQKLERRIGELYRRPTLPFNGYGEQVASLYRGMDLTVNF